MKQKIRIGCGAGFSGDRFEPAVILAEKGNLDYLVLECLAERTIALAQKRKLANPELGYDPFLERRISSLLPHLVKNNICLITNMGAANPLAAAKKVIELAKEKGFKVKVAAVFGDDVFDKIDFSSPSIETKQPLKEMGEVISANAYLGVEGILEALKADAHIIVTGRVADPSLFLAPMIHEFKWDLSDFDKLGKGTIVGHLLECAGHITGGYFADKGRKLVPDMDILGHPFADVNFDGSAVISKIEGTGGVVNLATAKEQLLYEVINPYEYLTPDVSADFTKANLKENGKNQVEVFGGTGKERPQTYKVSVGYKAYYLGEGEISYAGKGAMERSELAAEIIKKRLSDRFKELRIDFMGVNSTFGTVFKENCNPSEIRLRIAGKAQDLQEATIIGEEVETLYTNGPAGGGGVRKYQNEVIGIASILIDRKKIKPEIRIFES